MQTIHIRVTQTAAYDASALGTWEVRLTKDEPPGIAVGMALDIFHSHVAVDELDELELVVIDPNNPESVLREDDDYVCYSNSDAGDIYLIS